MGNKKFVVLIVLFLLVVIVGGVLFIFFNKSKTDVVIVKQVIYVDAIDVKTNKNINTKFIIVQDDGIIYDGEVYSDSIEKIEVNIDVNSTAPYFMNYDNDEYYSNAGHYTGGTKFQMEAVKIGELKIEEVSKNETQYVLNITSVGGDFREIGFCLQWSFSYLDIQTNYILINNPQRFSMCDKVFHTRLTLNENNSMMIVLNYKLVDELSDDDKLEVTFFDSDRSYLNTYIIENEEGKDVGGVDYLFVID